ncbi:MAG: hypothetical protein KF752_08270 [Pirellulaceae bacterium]|nr:hypothetical protein [Pirellulaceae bacterium]
MNDQRLPQEAASIEADAYQDLLHDLSAIIDPLQTLHQQAVAIHAPTVREMVRNGSRDKQLIEHTLDQLLDHACIPNGLVLFKTLCRYYWPIDPQATASYVYAYREMWDSDDEVESSEYSDLQQLEVANEKRDVGEALTKIRRHRGGKE